MCWTIEVEDSGIWLSFAVYLNYGIAANDCETLEALRFTVLDMTGLFVDVLEVRSCCFALLC